MYENPGEAWPPFLPCRRLWVPNFIHRLIICPNVKFLALWFRSFCVNKKCLNIERKKKKKKCRNRYNLILEAETACPCASKFEIFILLLRLVFELELLKLPIGISVFSSETRITRPIAPNICIKNDSYVPYLSSKFQVSTFSSFKVLVFSTSNCRIRNAARKKNLDFQPKRRGSPNTTENLRDSTDKCA